VFLETSRGGVVSETLRIDLDWEKKGSGIDPAKPARWKHRHEIRTTKESYDLLALMKKYEVTSFDSRISIIGDGTRWVELTIGDGIGLTGEKIESIIDSLREIYREGQVGVDLQSMTFISGKDLQDFASANRVSLNTTEVTQ